jgi:hypothetical protein
MANITLARRALEYAIQVTGFAFGLQMRANQRKSGL